ncbi:20S proteasome subunit beta 7 [Nematocida sp. AWRm77]|nr:20S proteasome subunit beta 7 [Nematocida sp. AWRm77]
MHMEVEEMGVYSVHDEPQRDNGKSFVVGTSVLGLKYKDGVMLASDTQLSYGSYAKYKNTQRVAKITDSTLLGCSGEYSNFQEMVHSLKTEMNPLPGEEPLFGPKECFEILRNHMYSKRCKGTPEMNTYVIAGVNAFQKDSLPYEGDESGLLLAAVDHLGGFYHSHVIATGIGGHIALPILRERAASPESITEKEAEEILTTAMKALVYRDTRASSKVQFSKVTKEGVTISQPIQIETSWRVGEI